MRSQTYIIKVWSASSYFLAILTLTSKIDSMEGLTWITKPSQIRKCTGQTAAFTWEYKKEAAEDIRQLQWRFNRTNLIAYSSKKTGFHVEPQYEGRVEKRDENEILLKNISAKDIGDYTLYPVIAWEESPNIPPLSLIVMDVIIQQWCTCERLPLSPEWTSGRNFSIVADGCTFEINSTYCCPKGPAIECMENDAQKLCVPIRNHIILTESSTQRRNTNNVTESTTHSIIVHEHTVLEERDTETGRVHLVLLVTNTTMVFLLIICCLAYVLWRKLGQDRYYQKVTQESNILLENVENRLNSRSKPTLSYSYHPGSTI